MSALNDDDDTFEPSSRPDSAYGQPENQGTNVARTTAIATLLADNRDAIAGTRDELQELGFPDVALRDDDRQPWRTADRAALLRESQRTGGPDEDRYVAWTEFLENGRPDAAVAFVVSVLASRLERESAAAAAVLWRQIHQDADGGPLRAPHIRWPRFPFSRLDPYLFDGYFPWFATLTTFFGTSELGEEFAPVPWNGELWQGFCGRLLYANATPNRTDAIDLLVQARLAQAMRSADRITRELAFAAFGIVGDGSSGRTTGSGPVASPSQSTMIHGTFAWKGDWWEPDAGGFHKFIRTNYRPNLYSGGASFSWDGWWSSQSRALAAKRLKRWCDDLAPHGLDTVFGHSYGGEVATRSRIDHGLPISQVVLLSCPVTPYISVAAADPQLSLVDVRLRWDPVLGIIGAGQRIRLKNANVTPVVLKRWRLDHGATHEEAVWRDEDIARLSAL